MLKSLEKHFSKWFNSPLLFFALFSEAPTARVLAQFLLGQANNGPATFVSAEHRADVDLQDFASYLRSNCESNNVQKVLELQEVKNSRSELLLLANGLDMWDAVQDRGPLGKLRDRFKRKYGGQGSNAQMTERGVKESGYVSLGNRGESTRSIYALARGDTIEEVGVAVRKEKRGKNGENNEEKIIQVQNKEKAKQVLVESEQQQKQLDNLRKQVGGKAYQKLRQEVWDQLTKKDAQFKAKRIAKKTTVFKERFHQPHVPNSLENRPGYHTTGLVEGKVQFGLLKKDDNFLQVKRELQARNIPFDPRANWTTLLNALKENEGDNKWFFPQIGYDSFVLGNLDKAEEERKVPFARLRKNENIAVIREELTLRNVDHQTTTNWTQLLTLLKENEGNMRSFLPRQPKERFTIAPPRQQGR